MSAKEYDPTSWDGEHALPILYSRTATGAVNTWEVWLDKGGGVVVRWGQKDGALQTTVFQCERKNVGRSNATTAMEQSRLEAISKWKKQLKKKYVLHLEDTASEKLIPMKAQEYKKREGLFDFPVDVQTKLDGVRCLVYREDGVVKLHSYGGDYYNVEHISETLDSYLPDDVILDGELYIHGVTLQNILSLVRRPQEGSEQLEFHCYDITSLDREKALLRWVTRKYALDAWYADAQEWYVPDCVVKVPTHTVGSHSEVMALHNDFVQQGYEGAIIRMHHGLYRFNYRSPEMLKLKVFDDAEFKIVGWKQGRGKFLDVPIFRCVCSGGEFDVTPKGTAEDRKQMLKKADTLVGKLLKVRYFGFSDDGLPKLPVGICIRNKGE